MDTDALVTDPGFAAPPVVLDHPRHRRTRDHSPARHTDHRLFRHASSVTLRTGVRREDTHSGVELILPAGDSVGPLGPLGCAERPFNGQSIQQPDPVEWGPGRSPAACGPRISCATRTFSACSFDPGGPRPNELGVELPALTSGASRVGQAATFRGRPRGRLRAMTIP